MPHLTVQITSDLTTLDPASLAKELHLSLEGSPDFAIERLKTQFHILPQVLTGAAAERAPVICIQLAVLAGRSEPIRKEYSSRLRTTLKTHLERNLTESVRVKVSVEVREMDRATYLT